MHGNIYLNYVDQSLRSVTDQFGMTRVPSQDCLSNTPTNPPNAAKFKAVWCLTGCSFTFSLVTKYNLVIIVFYSNDGPYQCLEKEKNSSSLHHSFFPHQNQDFFFFSFFVMGNKCISQERQIFWLLMPQVRQKLPFISLMEYAF